MPRAKKKSLSTQNLIAIFGIAATIIVAVISGVFNNLNTRTQIDRPIMFTQTAEAKSKTTAKLSTPTESALDWNKIIDINHELTFCIPLAFPEYLFSGSDPVKWLQQNGNEYFKTENTPNQELLYAPMVKENGNNSFNIFLTITNKSHEQDWIRLDKDATISVHYIEKAPDLTHSAQVKCGGGGGYFREFSTVILNSKFNAYESKAVSTDADFYTLQPGEFEVFEMKFVCESPGVYNVQINIPISYQGKNGSIEYTGVKGFICPDKMKYYLINPFPSQSGELVIDNVLQYEWTSSGYDKISP